MVGVIGTHNGKFHCDEVFACYMLKRLNQFRDYSILRTRDQAALENCNIVVDVGGVYDHSKMRYDHHQKEFTETMQTLGVLDFNTKLSSAGLVYAHYGKQLIAEILGSSYNDRVVEIFYKRLYETFVEAIDAVDNGIPQFDGTPRYHLGGTLSSRIGHLNPHWNEIDANPDERFQQAIELIAGEFESNVSYLFNVWWPAREIVEKAIEDAPQFDSSGKIVYISNGGVPWKEHFFQIEEEKGLVSRRMVYIVYEDSTAHNYRVQAIPKNSMSGFENRMPLPSAWRGLRGAELSEVSGIPGCVFVHITGDSNRLWSSSPRLIPLPHKEDDIVSCGFNITSIRLHHRCRQPLTDPQDTYGFIGGNDNLEGALAMAKKAIEIGEAELKDDLLRDEIEHKKAKMDSVMDDNCPTVQA